MHILSIGDANQGTRNCWNPPLKVCGNTEGAAATLQALLVSLSYWEYKANCNHLTQNVLVV